VRVFPLALPRSINRSSRTNEKNQRESASRISAKGTKRRGGCSSAWRVGGGAHACILAHGVCRHGVCRPRRVLRRGFGVGIGGGTTAAMGNSTPPFRLTAAGAYQAPGLVALRLGWDVFCCGWSCRADHGCSRRLLRAVAKRTGPRTGARRGFSVVERSQGGTKPSRVSLRCSDRGNLREQRSPHDDGSADHGRHQGSEAPRSASPIAHLHPHQYACEGNNKPNTDGQDQTVLQHTHTRAHTTSEQHSAV
jgi:hypothetical protein